MQRSAWIHSPCHPSVWFSHELLIIATCDSTSAASAPPLEWFCHQYCSSWKGKDPKYQCHATELSAALDTSPWWEIITCSGSYCVVNSLLAITRTAWKNPLIPIKSIITYGPLYLRTVIPDISISTMLSLPLKDKRHRRKNHNTMPSSSDQTFSCSHWKHVCLSNIGLISHNHVCNWCELHPSWSSFIKPSHHDVSYCASLKHLTKTSRELIQC